MRSSTGGESAVGEDGFFEGNDGRFGCHRLHCVVKIFDGGSAVLQKSGCVWGFSLRENQRGGRGLFFNSFLSVFLMVI